MRKDLIESHIKSLKTSFGSIKKPVDEEQLLELFENNNYAGMTKLIQETLHLDTRIRLGLVEKGGPNVPAWVLFEEPLPPYGTRAFKESLQIMYLRKSFLKKSTFEEVVIAIAHELCHVVLSALWHPLKDVEEVVDLTAMYLGFRDFYITGCSREIIEDDQTTQDFILVCKIRSVGYLSKEEVSHAAHFMTFC